MATQARAPSWIAETDWERNGNFAGVENDVSARIMARPGISFRRGRNEARPLGLPIIPSGSYELRNDDRVLSAEYAGSPIYGLLTSGPDTQIRATYGTDVTLNDTDTIMNALDVVMNGTYAAPVLKGILEKPKQKPRIGERVVGFEITGSMGKLRGGQPLYTPLRQSYRTDQAITEVLDLAGWPAGDRVISVGDTTLAWWWLNGQDPYEALLDLFLTEGAGAALYEDGAGRIHFENRNYRSVTTRSLTPQAVFADFAGADVIMNDPVITMNSQQSFMNGGIGAYWFTDDDYEPAHQDIVNDVSAVAKIRAAQALAKVWEHGSTISLNAGSSQTVIATGNDPWTGVVTPALTTDYTLTGTAAIAVSTVVYATRVEITFAASGSGSATIAGPGGATTGPQLRAQPVTVVSQQVITPTVTASVAASRAKHGRRRAPSNWQPRTELSATSMQSIVDALCAYQAEPRPVIGVTVRNADARHLLQQLTRDISDRVRLIEGHTGISADVWIESIVGSAGLQSLEIVWLCEKVRESNVALWGSALWGGSDGKGWGL